ncbi:hypothetical protein [Apilactobacillus xinyiensis]|uniref:hypothetical protein n=1 Tax=Apilactobacillus xinyiensis TaxID=2841032 RepID=UPI0033650442
MNFVTSLITGSFLAAIITAVFNRINSEKSSIHSESEWRADLYKLSQKTEISRQDLELFRTCLSATRGMDNKPLDERTAKRYPEIDDICLFYYHYLLEHNLQIDTHYNVIEKTKFVTSQKNPHLIISEQQKSSSSGEYVQGDKEKTVFRQLCRILLKSDWNTRDVKNSIMNKLSCVVKANEEDEKAIKLIYEVCDVNSLNDNQDGEIDKHQKKYFEKVRNEKYRMSIDVSKILVVISFLVAIFCVVYPENLYTLINICHNLVNDNSAVNIKNYYAASFINNNHNGINSINNYFHVMNDNSDYQSIIGYYKMYIYNLFVYSLSFYSFLKFSDGFINAFEKELTQLESFFTHFYCRLYFIVFISSCIYNTINSSIFNTLFLISLTIIFSHIINAFFVKFVAFKSINISYDFVDVKKPIS